MLHSLQSWSILRAQQYSEVWEGFFYRQNCNVQEYTAVLKDGKKNNLFFISRVFNSFVL